MVEMIYDAREITCYKDKLPILAREGYLRCKAKNYGWLRSEHFILPFILEEKYIFRMVSFTTNVIYIGDTNVDVEKSFLKEIINLLKANRIDFVGQPTTNAIFRSYPEGAIYAPYGSYVIDLSLTEEELFRNIHSTARKDIRRAQRDGLVVKDGGEFIKGCYLNIKAMNDRENRPTISFAELQKLKQSLGENLSFHVVVNDNIVESSLILAWSEGHSSFGLFAGSSPAAHPGASKLMHWEAMLDMKRRGVGVYDFVGARIKPREGSRLEGIQKFKSRMGGRMQTGYLWKYILNPFKYSLYIKLLKTKLRIKGVKYQGDIIDQENEEDRTITNI